MSCRWHVWDTTTVVRHTEIINLSQKWTAAKIFCLFKKKHELKWIKNNHIFRQEFSVRSETRNITETYNLCAHSPIIFLLAALFKLVHILYLLVNCSLNPIIFWSFWSVRKWDIFQQVRTRLLFWSQNKSDLFPNIFYITRNLFCSVGTQRKNR